jgi:predicted transcriptional regulator
MEVTMDKPELSDPITLRVPKDILADFEKIAAACERTRSWVMVRAFRKYLQGEGRDILNVVKGREAAAAGDVHDMDEVLKEIEDIVRGKVA